MGLHFDATHDEIGTQLGAAKTWTRKPEFDRDSDSTETHCCQAQLSSATNLCVHLLLDALAVLFACLL